MYHIAICDDVVDYIQYMKRLLFQSGFAEDEVTIYEYHFGEEMIQALEKHERIHLLILDMQMKKLGGNETAKLFRKQFPSAVMVFCSGSCMPTVESFETTPFRYLLKEYTDEKMIQELQAVVQETKNRYIEPVVLGTWKRNAINLMLSDILYIAIARNGCEIYVDPQSVKYEFEKHITSKKKLADVYEDLKDYGFEYAHNSYIVNLNHIKRITAKELQMSDGTILTVARSKEKELRLAFAKQKAKKY
ncbi:MAG: LytTR family transcriptional regulator DNA-binding domain-containing protein [Lachnospiraceae bacterium]|nr:LytTR family transcriptional regulator DNA-binding domain-containing protein [Lachnospiraceae bacterium]